MFASELTNHTLQSALRFREKMRSGQVCIGTNLTFSDLAVTEALCEALDFLWIDMEHNPLSLHDVQGHIIATRATGTTPLVRVRWNDPNVIKTVLDLGAPGIIVPMIKSVDDARMAVAACRYPPEGVRGYGPRRPSGYSRSGGPDYCQAANQAIICLVQIEHRDAVENFEQILDVPGLDGIVVGPMDLSGSLGHMANPHHPDVKSTIARILNRAREKGLIGGIAIGHDVDLALHWIRQGAGFVSLGCDYTFMIATANQLKGDILRRLVE